VAGAPGVMRTGGADRQLPQTASNLPLLVVMGLGSIGVAFGLMMFGKRTLDSVR
jgi:LPXTG-motif cell wall-anchored protein